MANLSQNQKWTKVGMVYVLCIIIDAKAKMDDSTKKNAI